MLSVKTLPFLGYCQTLRFYELQQPDQQICDLSEEHQNHCD